MISSTGIDAGEESNKEGNAVGGGTGADIIILARAPAGYDDIDSRVM